MKRLLYILFLVATPLFAQTTYQVATDGSGDYTTIAQVNAASFSPGDSILFRKGDIWRESLVVPSSGTSSNYIIFGSYGTGDRPKIYGSEVLTSFTAHGSLSNVYVGDQTISINPDNIGTYGASIYLKMNDSTTWYDTYEADINDLNANGEYAWSGNEISFYFDGAIGDIDSIEVTQRDRGIQISEEYITIDGLEIKYHYSRQIGTGIYPEVTSRGIKIKNCYLAYSCVRGGSVGYGLQLFHSNMLIDNVTSHDNGRRNISLNIVDQTGSVTMEDVEVKNCNLFSGWHTTGVDLAIQGANHTVNNIRIHHNKIWETTASKPTYINGIDIGITTVFIENNGDSADIDSVYFYNNELRNIVRTGLQMGGIGRGFVAYNTFTGKVDSITTNGHSLFFNANDYFGDGSNITCVNNIFYNYGDRDLSLTSNIWGRPEMTMTWLDYNLHYIADDATGNYIFNNTPPLGTSYRYTDSVAYRANEWGEHDILNPREPQFTSLYIDLTLQSTSPAIGAAIPLTTSNFPLAITTDINGGLRDVTNPDIGAYEYGASPPTPSTDTWIYGTAKVGGRTVTYKIRKTN